jgi:uncharacterized ferredoxin-like protein
MQSDLLEENRRSDMTEICEEGVAIVAKLMAVAARTAPKTAGSDWVQIKLCTQEEKRNVADMMIKVAERKAKIVELDNKDRADAIIGDWKSDARVVGQANLMLLIGIQGRKVAKLNCGGCGFSDCAEMMKQKQLTLEKVDFPGPFCMFRMMDISIAAGSAVKIAMDLNVDNRLMQKVGIAALKLRLLHPCDLILGIPLSATGKNIFFDRADKLDAWKILSSTKK